MLIKSKENSNNSQLERLVRMSSPELMVTLLLCGSALIFFVFTVAYLGTTPESLRVILSSKFSYSTSVLLLSSFYLYKIKTYFQEEKSLPLIHALWIIIFSGGIFTFLQLAGWEDLQTQIAHSGYPRSYHFLYLISGFHLLHVFALLIFSFWQLAVVYRNTRSSLKCLLYYTNPYEKTRLILVAKSWSFLHVIWAILFILFHIF